MSTIFQEDNQPIFTEEQVKEQANKEVAATEAILYDESYEEKLKAPLEKETSKLALEQKDQEYAIIENNAMQAISSGDAEATAIAVQKLNEEAYGPTLPAHYERGVLSKLGATPFWATDKIDYNSLDEEQKFVVDDLVSKVGTSLNKTKYIQSKFAEVQKLAEEQRTASFIADLAGQLPVFVDFFKTRGVGEEDFFDNFFELPDTTLSRIKSELRDPNLTEEEFKSKVDALYETVLDEAGAIDTNLISALDIFKGVSTEEGTNLDLWLGFDAVLAGIPAVMKGTKLVKTAAKANSTPKSAEITAEAVVGFEKGVDNKYTQVYNNENQAIQDIAPQEMSANLAVNPSHGKILDRLNALDPEFRRAIEESKINPLKSTEELIAKESLDKQTSKLFNNRPLIDSMLVGNPIGAVKDYYAVLGKTGSTDGYATFKGADSAAQKSLGLSPAEYDIIAKDDGYFIRYTKPVNPAAYTGTLDIGIAENVGPVSSIFKSATSYLSNTDDYLYSFFKRNQVKNILTNKLKPLSTLNKEKKKLFDNALAYNQKRDKWFETEDELIAFTKDRGLKYEPKDWSNYNLLRQANDADWFMRNQKVYDELKSNNYITLDLGNSPLTQYVSGTRVTGKEIAKDSLADSRVFDVETGTLFKKGELTDWEDLKAKGYKAYVIVEPEMATKLGKPSVYIAKGKTLTDLPLSFDQLGYRAGGRRVYSESKYLIQQANRVADDLVRPSTRSMFNDIRKAEEYVNKMEGARGIYREWLQTGNDAIASQKFDELGINRGWEDVRDAFNNGEFNADEAFELVRKGETTREVGELSEELQDLVDTGMLYYSKRNKHLTDLSGTELETLSATDALNKALAQSVSTNTISQYANRAMKEWVNTFYRGKRPQGQSIANLFNTAKENLGGLSQQELNAAIATRDAIKRFIGGKGQWAKAWDAKLDYMGYKLHEKYPNIPSTIFEGSILSKNPISFLRGVTFHSALGLLTLHNFIVQGQQALMIAATGGTNMPRHLSRGTLLSTASRVPNGDMKAFLTKIVSKGFDDNTDEMVRMLEAWDDSTLGVIDDTVAYLDQTGTSGFIGLNHTKQVLKKGLDYGRLPFDMTERLNRGVAFARAWDDLGYSTVKGKLTQDQKVALIGKTNKYALDMLSSRMSAFQTNQLLALPTQFYSYSVRLWEAMMPQLLGGSAKWTAKERAAIWVTLVGMYGSDAIPFTQSYYEGFTESLLGKDSEAKKIADKGIIDSMFYMADINSDIGARTGPQGQFEDIFYRFAEPDETFMEVFFGATGGITWQMMKGAGISAMISMDNPEAGLTYLTDVVSDNITTLRNIKYTKKALATADEFGLTQRATRYGDVGAPLTTEEAKLIPFGVPTESYYALQDWYRELKRIQELPRSDQAKYIGKYFKDALMAEDKQESDKLIATGKSLLDNLNLPESQKNVIIRKAQKRNDYWQKTTVDYWKTFGKLPDNYDAIMQNYKEEE